MSPDAALTVTATSHRVDGMLSRGGGGGGGGGSNPIRAQSYQGNTILGVTRTRFQSNPCALILVNKKVNTRVAVAIAGILNTSYLKKKSNYCPLGLYPVRVSLGAVDLRSKFEEECCEEEVGLTLGRPW